MPNLEKAVERIKTLQCPTGELENRIIGILEDYKVATRNEIVIDRDHELYKDEEWNRDGTETYRIKISNKVSPSITVIAKSGQDDYVAQVVDAYIH